MTQTARHLIAHPAVRRAVEALVSRLALAVLLAYLTVVVPGAVRATAKGGPLEGVQAVCTLTAWLVQGFWNAIIGG